jgi:oligopeptide transport system permease protein
MSSLTTNPSADLPLPGEPAGIAQRVMRSRRVLIGGGLLLGITLQCVASLPWTLHKSSGLFYDNQNSERARVAPESGDVARWFGTDGLGRSLLGRCLLGGAISLAIGIAAATISVVLGVSVGLLAGYRGGWVDALLMRMVDVLYGLPYILMVVLFKIAFERGGGNNLVVLFVAIGLVSWLTMARVVRGQVLSLRAQPFIEAARAAGLTQWRIFLRHLLPNLVGPITVYATLIIPQAILQESFLSFLGIGIQKPLPTWGSLASEGLLPALNPIYGRWWMLVFPCGLLAITLLSLNYLGDGLRDVLDPKRDEAKV